MFVPVVLFTYNRLAHLRRVLDCLAADHVPLIFAFSDGPRNAAAAGAVSEVRNVLHGVDWCEMVISERDANLGLGQSIRAGVANVLSQHEAVLVIEDDLVFVPGTYRYLSAALEHYCGDARVMSVAGWTHPSIRPGDVTDTPYFDGRAECWLWGTWARAWRGMEQTAEELMVDCRRRGIDVYRYGADLPAMAEVELSQNIWAVRWLYLHLSRGGLCLRPPHSLVEHMGFDALATNASDGGQWSNPALQASPAPPFIWPEVQENQQCPGLWQQATGGRPPILHRALHSLRRMSRLRS